MAGKVQRKRHLQLSLDSARKPERTHGGWRPKAGRKRKRGATSHDARPEFAGRFPQHVTLRTVDMTVEFESLSFALIQAQAPRRRRARRT